VSKGFYACHEKHDLGGGVMKCSGRDMFSPHDPFLIHM
jgi:hypothetical protein